MGHCQGCHYEGSESLRRPDRKGREIFKETAADNLPNSLEDIHQRVSASSKEDKQQLSIRACSKKLLKDKEKNL